MCLETIEDGSSPVRTHAHDGSQTILFSKEVRLRSRSLESAIGLTAFAGSATRRKLRLFPLSTSILQALGGAKFKRGGRDSARNKGGTRKNKFTV